jgi:hypothetical protein
MKRVKVDFSTTVKGGLIRANQKRASETLNVGDEVEAYDPAEDMEFEGVVEQLSDDGQFAFLRMYWEDIEPAPYVQPSLNLFVTSLVGMDITAKRMDETPIGAADQVLWRYSVAPSQPVVSTSQPISTPA